MTYGLYLSHIWTNQRLLSDQVTWCTSIYPTTVLVLRPTTEVAGRTLGISSLQSPGGLDFIISRLKRVRRKVSEDTDVQLLIRKCREHLFESIFATLPLLIH